MADETFSEGDHVTWKSHGGTAEGTVEKKITEDTEAAGRTVRASTDDPQYLVKNEKSGGEAAHKAGRAEEDVAPTRGDAAKAALGASTALNAALATSGRALSP